MFTGIVEELGKITGLDLYADSARMTVAGPLVTEAVAPGSSIAVNGVCLTVTQSGNGQFTVDVMGETLASSALGALASGQPVNLERPVTPGGRLDGHIVQGHVDGVGVVAQTRLEDGWRVLRISVPTEISRYIARKGSVAVDGVSLTVSEVSPLGKGGADEGEGSDWFEVSLIPETITRTTLGESKSGDVVNIEVDVIAKYVERLLAVGAR
jgi:riboflavin synthase